MRVLSITTMNRCAENDISAYVNDSEGHYLRQIDKTAAMLAENAASKPVILLSGPSGSGKTTTAFRIREKLREIGFDTYALSMDNYFLPIHDPRNEAEEDGKIDFESPKRLDKELLSEHFSKLLNGEEFTLPIFDFAKQKRSDGDLFQRRKHELVILEGIHALNPDVTGVISEQSSGVYVSVRTRMKNKKGKLLHPSKIRLMRRLVRDKLFRGRKAEQTLEFFENVQNGEKKYILPYKCYAEYNIDTFIAYEAAVYKKFLTDELNSLDQTAIADLSRRLESELPIGANGDALELARFLAELDDVDLEYAPVDSLVREFAGGSSFKY